MVFADLSPNFKVRERVRKFQFYFSPATKASRKVANFIKNKTGLQLVSRPVEQPLVVFKTVKKCLI